jgi:PucR C-terminal helix-turn-helix domain/GGDEF-like domain
LREGLEHTGLRLGDILSSVDSELLSLIGGPLDPTARITDVVIFDPADLHAVGAGTIVLAVAVPADGNDAVGLLEHAGERGAAAVVFRSVRQLPPRIKRLAAALGIAVLGAPPDVRWSHVFSLLRTAMVNTGGFQLPVESAVAVGDLFALADAIAGAVGGPVTIEDPHWRVLAYSNLGYEIDEPRRDTILGRTPPAEWRQRLDESGLTTALRTRDDVHRFEGKPGEGLAPRLVAPVRAGDELLGTVWVAETDRPLGDAAERELARAAKLATVHLLGHRASEDIKRRTRGAFVREVLEGWAPSRSAVGLLRPSGPFTVLVFAVDAPTPPPRELNLERVLSIVSLYGESRHPDAMCALVEERIWSVLPALSADERQPTLELAARILDRVETSLELRLVGAIGTTVPRIADVPESRRAAEQALKVLMRRKDGARVVHIEDVRAHTILLQIIDWASENDELTQGKLEKLREHDREHGTSYRATLRAYLDAWGDIRVAAERLSVHANTLRHRLRRLVEISGIDLDDPEERLVTELQLRIH